MGAGIQWKAQQEHTQSLLTASGLQRYIQSERQQAEGGTVGKKKKQRKKKKNPKWGRRRNSYAHQTKQLGNK